MGEALHVFLSGRVQGVGFRQSTVSEARRLHLTGWVRNLPDGRVEAHFEGDRDAQDAILAWCQKGPSFSNVHRVDVSWGSTHGQCSAFEIRYSVE